MAKLEKGGFNLDKDSAPKIDLEKGKEAAQQAADAVNENMEELVDEVRDAVPVEDAPADIELPKAERDLEKALETGDIEPPRKKNFAWLWAIIGIAVVLAFIAMIMLNRGEKSSDVADDAAPAMIMPSDSPVDSAVATGAEAVSESAQSVVGAAAETVGNVASEGAQAVSSAVGAAADKASSAIDAVSGKAEVAVEKVANTVSGVPASVETAAVDVIKGDFGNGNVRKEKLGSRYQEIQTMVNQMKRQGKF